MIQVVAQKVKLIDGYTSEEKIEILFIRDSKTYRSALFKPISRLDRITEVLVEEKLVAASDKDMVVECIRFYKENTDVVHDNIEKTMKKFSYDYGFTKHKHLED